MEFRVLVMFDNQSQKLIPINEGIYAIAQFSNEKKLNEKYVGNLVLYPSGDVKEIAQVRIIGVYGKTFLSKLFSIFNSTCNIKVKLVDCQFPFNAILDKAITYLNNDQASNDPYMPQQDKLITSVSNIDTPAKLYAALKLPNPEDCLDVMV